MRTLMLLLCLSIVPLANGQVSLPSVRVPMPAAALPNLPATDVLRPRLDAEFLGTDLRDLRALRIRTLLRVHGDVVEADPHGNPMVRGEVLAVSPDAAALHAAAAAGFSVAREFTLDVPPTHMVVLHIAARTARALERLRALDPDGVYDFNHIYIESGAVSAAPTPSYQSATLDDETTSTAPGASPGRIGLIDSGVDSAHEAFSGLTVHQHGCSPKPVPEAHGTAVASLMVGRAAALHGAAPGSELYAADVYCGQATGGAVQRVVEAFSWLAHEGVPVINVSLVGPPNRILEVVVEGMIARGHIVVAAVGNDGPAATLYPASWSQVVGVTGVDAHQRALAEAARGTQVKFAAPGAQMAAARCSSGYTLVRGTSFAAPIVAGLLSLKLQIVDNAAADKAVATLASEAQHLGSSNPDPAYGYGLVGASLRRQPALAAFRVD